MSRLPTIPHVVSTLDPKQYRELMWKLASIPDGARIAAFTAINKTAAHVRTNVAALVSDAMGARISSINKRLTVKKASKNRLFAQIDLHGKYGVSLIGFGATQNATGVAAKIFGSNKEFPHAFIARGLQGGRDTAGKGVLLSGGSMVVFKRLAEKRIMKAGRYKGKIRQALETLKGPAVTEVFENTPGLVDKAMADAAETMQKNLNSQINWLLNRGSSQVVSEAA